MKSMTSYDGWKIYLYSQNSPCSYSMELENMTTGDKYSYDCAGNSMESALDYAKETIVKECSISASS